jgi:hypothetical protein
MSGNGNGVDLEVDVPGNIQGFIRTFHDQAHDAVVNVNNTITNTTNGGGYSGQGAQATATSMANLQKFWDTELEPILTELYELVGGAGEELAAQDQLGAQAAAAVEAGSGMTGKSGRLG